MGFRRGEVRPAGPSRARPGESDIEQEVDDLLRLAGDWAAVAGPLSRPRLIGLAEAIRRWNQAINLISRKDIDRLVSYHFCDSASVLPIVGRPGQPARLEALDVGGSNGLPGLVLAALLPRMNLLICDSRQKRRGFLEEACDGSNARFEIDRVDGAGFLEKHSQAFDLIVARAVTQMGPLVRWCMPLLAPGGRLVAYKGSRCADEVRRAEGEIFGCGGGRLAAVAASPWADTCNPLRIFAIAGKA